MSNRIKLRVQGLTSSQIQSGAYALILAEENGLRRVPIIVGTAEAQSIAIALEHLMPPRPLTHDLFISFSHAFNIELREVFIYKFEDGVFYSELTFLNGERTVKIDSRTSDAIAIALRVPCDIYISDEILEECSVVIEDDQLFEEEMNPDDSLEGMEPEDIKDEALLRKWLQLRDVEDLEARLEQAIQQENYEFAKIYKEELSRRKQRDK